MVSTHARVVVTAVLLLALCSAAGFAHAGAVVQGDPPEPTTEKHPPSDSANFTILPQGQASHRPGTTDADYMMLSKGAGPWNGSKGLAKIAYYKITSQQATFGSCSPQDARAFGIDRGNDDPGTKTDTPLLGHMEGYSIDGRVISVNIYDEGDLGGEPTHLNATDETVAYLVNCIENHGPKGWYQFTGYVNGTNYQGEFQEVTLFSEYFYICDCANRSEAVATLGPPPYSGDTTPTPTATPRSTATATTTATPTPVSTAVETATATRQADADADTRTATATPQSTPTGESTPRRTQVQAAGTAEADDVVTPTVASGPGFGTLVALVGLAVLALGRRH